jgi:predicted site-specific integrase-resolvase
MKVKDYARQQGISYRTAWRWWKAGKLPGHQMDTGTILIETEPPAASHASQRAAIYARVSSAENMRNLESQAERLAAYCAARGYQVAKVVKEVGSGVDDTRPKLLALLEDQSIGLIVVEHKDRLTRFSFRYLETLLNMQGRGLEVVNQAENGTEGLLADRAASVYSFCARLYGQRRAKRKTEAIVRELEAREPKGDGDATG